MNKIDERLAFDAVFGNRDIVVENCEEPDFICTAREGEQFGVEVTEFFLTESDARLKKLDMYGAGLLSGADFRHKDDKKNIQIEEVTRFRDEREPGIKINAILKFDRHHDDTMPMLLSSISTKTEKHSRYSQRVKVVDLIVDDVCSDLKFDTVRELLLPISQGCNYSLIATSPFREIYLLTESAQKGNIYVRMALSPP
jgi:hypothetical protein